MGRGPRGQATAGLTALILTLAPDAGRALEACGGAGLEPAQIVAVEPRLELRLADGRHVRLAGLDPALSTPDAPDRDETARAAFAALLAGRAVALRVLTGTPDRWGRIVAQAVVTQPAPVPAGPAPDAPKATVDVATTTDVAVLAIGAGLARYRAEPSAHPCRASLLAAEAAAREAGRGLWADRYYGVLASDDTAAFPERAGTTVIAQGRVARVEPTPFRTRLTFADPGRDGDGPEPARGGRRLSVTIVPRVVKTVEAGGVHLAALIGRSVRIRGLLDLRFGPQIELTGPDQIELVGPLAGSPSAAVADPPREHETP